MPRARDELTETALWSSSVALGGVLFALDSFTPTDGAASAVYGGVLVILAERRRRKIILATTCVCALLTAASYLPAHGLSIVGDSIFRRAVSVAAIVTAAVLTLRNLSEQEIVSEQLKLLELSSSALFVRTRDGRITYWSPGAERLYGWPASHAVGQDARRLLQMDRSAVALAEVEFAATGQWNGDVEQTSRDTSRLIVLSSWVLQRDERGRATGVLETGIDVTRQRRSDRDLATSEARYRALFNTAGIAIFEEDYSRVIALLDEVAASGVTDLPRFIRDDPAFVLRCVAQVRIVDVNDGAVRLFRAADKQDLMQSLSRLYPPGSAGSFAEILVALAEDRPSCAAQTIVRTLDDQKLTVQMSITFPKRRANMTGVLVSIMDVSKRQEAEQDLARARTNLARVGQSFTLGEMVASIAHEMNQPLAAVVTNAEAALRWLGRSEPNRDEAANAVERIAHESERATRIVQRIRSFCDTGPLSFAPFDLGAAIAEATLLLRHEFDANGITLAVELDAGLPQVMGDRVQIEQVITNLLINAMQAVGELAVATPAITVRVAMRPAGLVCTEIDDNGPGVPAEIAGQLFRPFFSTKTQGMGLGLAISRKIVVLHGGDISVGRADGGGASVRFTLPIAGKAYQGVIDGAEAVH